MFNNQLNTTHTRTQMHLRGDLQNFQVFVKIYLRLRDIFECFFFLWIGNALIISYILLYLYNIS